MPDRDRIYRSRLDSLSDQLERLPQAVPAVRRELVQLYEETTFPASAGKFFMAHPVMLNGTESEGSTLSAVVDSAISMPVLVLGTAAPSIGDLLIAHAVAGRWVAERGGSADELPCSPCSIPREDLTVEWTNIITGDGSATMTYGGAGPDSWASACTNGLLYILSCNAGSIYFRVVYFVAGTCPTGTREECSTTAGGLIADTITCSPLSLKYTLTNVSCPVLYSSGFTSFTVRT